MLEYYFIEKFKKSNLHKQNKNTTIIYRNYTKPYNLKKILDLKNYCKRNGLKFIMANNIKLAIKLNLDGAYLPSFNKNYKHLSFKFKKNFILIGSAHNLKEIRVKELQKVSEIFLSSIFKRNSNYLGVNKFKILSNLSNRKIIALGGVSDDNIKSLGLTQCEGLAGISYFKSKKKAPKKGPF